MIDMRVPIVGTVLTHPERRVTEKTSTAMTTFRIVMNYRRYDRATEQWVDHGMLRVRVVCWRRLADHVYSSIKVGEPVIVIGRMFTRDWTTAEGELRVNYELEADTVGHDLSRGVTAFTKARPEGPNSVIEDAEADRRIGGEVSFPVDENGLPLASDPYEGSEVAAESADDAMAILREAGMAETGAEPSSGEDEDDEELVGSGVGGRRRRGR
jgi:single-strand DNA-binding protein